MRAVGRKCRWRGRIGSVIVATEAGVDKPLLVLVLLLMLLLLLLLLCARDMRKGGWQ